MTNDQLLVAQQLAPLHYIVATRRDCCTVRTIVARFAAPRICGTPFFLSSPCLLYFDDKRFGKPGHWLFTFWLKWLKNLRFLNVCKKYIILWQLLSCPIFSLVWSTKTHYWLRNNKTTSIRKGMHYFVAIWFLFLHLLSQVRLYNKTNVKNNVLKRGGKTKSCWLPPTFSTFTCKKTGWIR